jgi:hypothetical protein
MALLIQSYRWRDGGSISAIVLDGERCRAFWLQTNDWDHPRNAGHDNLFVSEGDAPELKQKKIEIASDEERQWLDYLARVDDSGAKDESKEQLQAMICVLRARGSPNRGR